MRASAAGPVDSIEAFCVQAVDGYVDALADAVGEVLEAALDDGASTAAALDRQMLLARGDQNARAIGAAREALSVTTEAVEEWAAAVSAALDSCWGANLVSVPPIPGDHLNGNAKLVPKMTAKDSGGRQVRDAVVERQVSDAVVERSDRQVPPVLPVARRTVPARADDSLQQVSSALGALLTLLEQSQGGGDANGRKSAGLSVAPTEPVVVAIEAAAAEAAALRRAVAAAQSETATAQAFAQRQSDRLKAETLRRLQAQRRADFVAERAAGDLAVEATAASSLRVALEAAEARSADQAEAIARLEAEADLLRRANADLKDALASVRAEAAAAAAGEAGRNGGGD